MKKLITLVIIIPFMGFTQESILEKRFELEIKTQNTTSAVYKIAQHGNNKNKLDSCFLRKRDKIATKEKIKFKKFEELKHVFSYEKTSKLMFVKEEHTIQSRSEKENKASCFLSTPINLYTQKMERNILCLTSYSSEYIQNKSINFNKNIIKLNLEDSGVFNIDFRNKVPFLHNGIREEINRKGILTF